MNILLGLLSILVFLGIAFICSENRKKINVRAIVTGLLLQVAIIFFVIKTTIGQKILEMASNGVSKVLSFGNSGLEFVFGGFATDNYSFFINVLCMIAFTSALISVLYYLRVIPFLVKHIGGAIAKIMGTSAPETFCAVGNAFLGGTEAPILIKPYMSRLTRSELFAVITGGFASASAGVIGGYALLGIPMKYLLVAMATVPFSTLLISKILVPETEESKLKQITIEKSEHNNIFEAIGNGAIQGILMAINISAVLIGFLGIVALLDYCLAFVGTSTTELLGYLFTPVAWMFNIAKDDVQAFSSLIGMKTSLNEFVAFTEMGNIVQTLQPRTVAILSVALCNFANFSFIGITLGAFNSLCGERLPEASKLCVKALIGGLLTTLISGSLIGLFF